MKTLKGRIGILLKDSAVYGIGGTVSKFIGLFLLPIFTRVFTPAEYGIISLITTSFSIISIILIMGMDSAVARHYYDNPDDKDEVKKILSTGMFFEVIISVISCSILLLLSKSITRLILGEDIYQSYIILAISGIPFYVLGLFFLNLLKWKRESYKYIGLTLSQALVMSLLSIYFVVSLRRGIEGIYTARLIAYIFIFVMGFIITFRNYSFIFSYTLLKKLLLYGLPLVVAGLSGTIMAISDQYFLNFYTSFEDVGLYTIGRRIASLSYLIVLGFKTAWAPFALSIHQEKDAKQTYAKILEYYVILTSLLFMTLTVFSEEFLLLLSTEKYLGGAKVIGFLTFNVVLQGIFDIFWIGIGITKKTLYITISVTSGAIANLLLNFALVPRFGMQGAAVATLLATLISVVLIYIFSQRVYPIKYNLAKFFTTLPLAFVVVGISSIMPNFSFFVDIVLKLLLMFVWGVIILLVILDAKERHFLLTLHQRIPILFSWRAR